MTTRFRKVRRQRGSRTHGWGTSGQHRDRGMRGGTGRAGEFKHKWTRVLRLGGERYGKLGFNPPNREEPNAINVGELESLADRVGAKGEGKVEIDLSRLGFQKLLGEGRVGRAFVVKVAKSSELAAKKVAESGGQVITPERK